jgi:hypothetical protein
MDAYEKLGFVGLVSVIVLMIAAAIGWIANVVQIVHLAGGPVTTLFIVKIVGVFAPPLGAIMGWVGILS